MFLPIMDGRIAVRATAGSAIKSAEASSVKRTALAFSTELVDQAFLKVTDPAVLQVLDPVLL
jgi:hypothetical protein